MITLEIIDKDSVLKGLTDEQKKALCELSKNDEDTVISAKFKEFHNGIDAVVKEVTGIDNDGSKTSDYLRRALAKGEEYRKTAEERQRQIDELKAGKPSDDEAKKQLAAKDAAIADLTKKFAELSDEKDRIVSQHAKEIEDMGIQSEITAALGGIKFNASMPQSAIDVLKHQAVDSVRGKNPAYIDDGNGGKRLVFRDENGVELRNPENRLEPYTASELLTKAFSDYGVLEVKKSVGGSGSGQQTPKNKGILGATTKAEAMDAIEKEAMDKGYVRGTLEFNEAVANSLAEHAEAYNALQ